MNKLNKLFFFLIIVSAFLSFMSSSIVVNAAGANTIVNPSTNNTNDIINPSQNNTEPQTNQANKSSSIIPLQNPLSNKFNSVGGLINGFMEIFTYVVVILAVLALIWVGFQFIMAQGNSDKLSELKTWLYYIVIGVAIVIGAKLIVSVVINTLEATGTVSPTVIQKANQALNNQ